MAILIADKLPLDAVELFNDLGLPVRFQPDLSANSLCTGLSDVNVLVVRSTRVTADAIEAAIRGGVRRVHVISHDLPDSLLLEVFTNEGTGTLVVDDIQSLSAAEQSA